MWFTKKKPSWRFRVFFITSDVYLCCVRVFFRLCGSEFNLIYHHLNSINNFTSFIGKQMLWQVVSGSEGSSVICAVDISLSGFCSSRGIHVLIIFWESNTVSDMLSSMLWACQLLTGSWQNRIRNNLSPHKILAIPDSEQTLGSLQLFCVHLNVGFAQSSGYSP